MYALTEDEKKELDYLKGKIDAINQQTETILRMLQDHFFHANDEYNKWWFKMSEKHNLEKDKEYIVQQSGKDFEIVEARSELKIPCVKISH